MTNKYKESTTQKIEKISKILPLQLQVLTQLTRGGYVIN